MSLLFNLRKIHYNHTQQIIYFIIDLIFMDNKYFITNITTY
jgi:hypothetical protein